MANSLDSMGCIVGQGMNLAMITFRIGLSLVFGVHMEMGAIGVWIAMVVDWIFRVCCFVGRYFKGTWKKYWI